MVEINIDEKTIAEIKRNLANDGIEKVVVGAIIVKEGKVLLLRRISDDFMGGLVELPSGAVDQEEEFLDALIRETKEETDLQILSIDRYVNSFEYSSRSGKKTRQLNFLVAVKGDVQLDQSEHDKYFWVDPASSDFESFNISDHTKSSIKKAL
jgi:8-oxo-dGTP diphosphatase